MPIAKKHKLAIRFSAFVIERFAFFSHAIASDTSITTTPTLE
jgi:hypothetical protein